MATMTTFNPVQKHLLQMFGHLQSKTALRELRQILLQYYAEKTQEGIDKFWDENMDENSVHEILKEHLRTPYVHAKTR